MEKIYGKEIISHIKNGKTVCEKNTNDDHVAKWTNDDVYMTSFSNVRTVDLGNYEYARVGMGISVGILVKHENNDYLEDEVSGIIENAVEAVLDREESCLRGKDINFSPISLNGVGVKVSIWLSYGLTFKKNKTESHKVDISLERRLSDGSDFEEQLIDLQKKLGDRIAAYKQSILGSECDVGF